MSQQQTTQTSQQTPQKPPQINIGGAGFIGLKGDVKEPEKK